MVGNFYRVLFNEYREEAWYFSDDHTLLTEEYDGVREYEYKLDQNGMLRIYNYLGQDIIIVKLILMYTDLSKQLFTFRLPESDSNAFMLLASDDRDFVNYGYLSNEFSVCKEQMMEDDYADAELERIEKKSWYVKTLDTGSKILFVAFVVVALLSALPYVGDYIDSHVVLAMFVIWITYFVMSCALCFIWKIRTYKRIKADYKRQTRKLDTEQEEGGDAR